MTTFGGSYNAGNPLEKKKKQFACPPTDRFWTLVFQLVILLIFFLLIKTFTFLLAGIVCIISKSGGTQGVAQSLVKYISSSTSALWVTYIEGLLIFFDV